MVAAAICRRLRPNIHRRLLLPCTISSRRFSSFENDDVQAVRAEFLNRLNSLPQPHPASVSEDASKMVPKKLGYDDDFSRKPKWSGVNSSQTAPPPLPPRSSSLFDSDPSAGNAPTQKDDIPEEIHNQTKILTQENAELKKKPRKLKKLEEEVNKNKNGVDIGEQLREGAYSLQTAPPPLPSRTTSSFDSNPGASDAPTRRILSPEEIYKSITPENIELKKKPRKLKKLDHVKVNKNKNGVDIGEQLREGAYSLQTAPQPLPSHISLSFKFNSGASDDFPGDILWLEEFYNWYNRITAENIGLDGKEMLECICDLIELSPGSVKISCEDEWNKDLPVIFGREVKFRFQFDLNKMAREIKTKKVADIKEKLRAWVHNLRLPENKKKTMVKAALKKMIREFDEKENKNGVDIGRKLREDVDLLQLAKYEKTTTIKAALMEMARELDEEENKDSERLAIAEVVEKLRDFVRELDEKESKNDVDREVVDHCENRWDEKKMDLANLDGRRLGKMNCWISFGLSTIVSF